MNENPSPEKRPEQTPAKEAKEHAIALGDTSLRGSGLNPAAIDGANKRLAPAKEVVFKIAVAATAGWAALNGPLESAKVPVPAFVQDAAKLADTAAEDRTKRKESDVKADVLLADQTKQRDLGAYTAPKG